MRMMGKVKIIIVLFLLLFIISSARAYDFQANCEERTFVVTAYYSPKSWQAFYYKDSFEAEKTLNWEWLHWASGKWVFNGMLAAPSSYAFGGLLYFPSLGWVWEIADRWWAIVHAGEKWHSYDRIDVWMWTGELGLVRALTFGKQTITWYYCDAATVKSKWIKAKIWFNLWAIPIYKYFFDYTLFIQELNYDRKDVWVYKLQEYLIKFGYLDKKSGYFGTETKNALCKYQLSRWLSTKKYCGTFGSKTRYFMKNEAKSKWFLPEFTETTTIDELVKYAKNYNSNEAWKIKNEEWIDSVWTKKITNYFTEPYKNGTVNEKIWNLQDMLRHYGFYKWEITNTYDKKTVQAVYDFQIAAGILKKDDTQNSARWWMWPSTRNKLNEKRAEFQTIRSSKEWKNNNDNENVTPQIVEEWTIKDEWWKSKIANYFSEPYKNGTVNEKIGDLQDTLRHYGFYKWELTNTYDKNTIQAVYDFQVAAGILKASDKSNSARWWMWPSTRDKLNEKRNEFQKFKNNK
jgi:peptidoglycan hydrolase-like protein with peptidoglycan-binding domain